MNSELRKFGLRNGGDGGVGEDSRGLLNEKWESIAVVPVDGKKGRDGEYFVFSISDNDFITQDGESSSFPLSLNLIFTAIVCGFLYWETWLIGGFLGGV